MTGARTFDRRRFFWRLGELSLPVLFVAGRVEAGVLAGMATEWTQLLNNVQLVASHLKQAEQLVQQINMYRDMVLNTAQLPFQVWGSISAELARLHRIVQGGRSLAYSMANLDAEFRNRFRGWGYSGNWYTDYREWSQTTLDTSLQTLKAANLQAEDMNTEEAVLTRLRTFAGSSDGRLKILQTGAQLAEQTIQQLQKLRQIMLADVQSKQAFQAAQIQKETTGEFVKSNLFQSTSGGRDVRRFVPGW